jgi:predicted acyltransferase
MKRKPKKPVHAAELDNRTRALKAAYSRLSETSPDIWAMTRGLGLDGRNALASYVLPMLLTRIKTLESHRRKWVR